MVSQLTNSRTDFSELPMLLEDALPPSASPSVHADADTEGPANRSHRLVTTAFLAVGIAAKWRRRSRERRRRRLLSEVQPSVAYVDLDHTVQRAPLGSGAAPARC
jgi:hypothetical protein